MIRGIIVEMANTEVFVECDVYNDRRIRQDDWWQETEIYVEGDASELLRHFSSNKGAYEELMDRVEAALINEDSQGVMA